MFVILLFRTAGDALCLMPSALPCCPSASAPVMIMFLTSSWQLNIIECCGGEGLFKKRVKQG